MAPKIFKYVFAVVSDNNELSGCSMQKIIVRTKKALKRLEPEKNPRNVVVQIRKAVKFGLDNGMFKERRGKICLKLPEKNKPPTRNTRTKTSARKSKNPSKKTPKPKSLEITEKVERSRKGMDLKFPKRETTPEENVEETSSPSLNIFQQSAEEQLGENLEVPQMNNEENQDDHQCDNLDCLCHFNPDEPDDYIT